jgi:molybdopterin-guanine dinucleotide biosynthesis protein B
MKVVGFAGYSGAGKTTLLEQVIAQFKARGLRVSVIKHAHHRFDIDRPGKDSWRHREAGAVEVLIASRQRLALMREFERETELTAQQLIAELQADVDWVLVEGFAAAICPRSRSGAPRPGTRRATPTTHSPWRLPPTMRPGCPFLQGAPCSI